MGQVQVSFKKSIMKRFLAFLFFLTFVTLAHAVTVDENLVLFLSDFHCDVKPSVRYVSPVETKRGPSMDFSYTQTGREGEFRVEYDTLANLRVWVSRIVAMDPRPAYVIMLGDDINVPSEDGYKLVKETLKPLDDAGIPYAKIMGNHDRPQLAQQNDVYLRVFSEFGPRSISPSKDWQAFRVSLKDVDLVLFETFDPLRGDWEKWFTPAQKEKYGQNDGYLRYHGAFFPEQVTWMESVLKAQPLDRPIFFCGHHPTDVETFFPQFKDFPQFQGWIHGHFHNFYRSKTDSPRSLSIPSSGVVGVGTFQTPPAAVKMQILPTAYRFTLWTLDETDPMNGKEIVFEKQ